MIREHLELLEAYAYAGMLTESQRADYLAKNFSEKLQAAFASETTTIEMDQAVEAHPGDTVGKKVLSYIMSYDPSRNKQYSQWLVQRYIKGEYRLEDLSRATEYLTVFERAKGRLEKKDINAYKTLGELYIAVRPFIEGETAVSARQERSQALQTMKSDENITVVHDDGNLLILSPRNEEASNFWGKGTQWCTAATRDNRFYSYNSEGPLYIVIDRKAGRKWQLHTPSGQFMDETDSRISLPQLIDTYPVIFSSIGEDYFLPVAKDIGIDRFSPLALMKMNAAEIAHSVGSFEQLMAVPEEMRNLPEFAQHLLAATGTGSESFKKYIQYYAKMKFSDDFWDERIVSQFAVLKHLPPRMQTDERKILLSGRLNNPELFMTQIPKPWPKAVTDRHWYANININHRIELEQIPSEYINSTTVSTILGRQMNPTQELMKKYDRFVDDSVICTLVKKNINFSEFIPARCRTASVATALAEAWTNTGHGFNSHKPAKAFSLFSPSLWPKDRILKILEYADKEVLEKIDFNTIPREFLTGEFLSKFIGRTSVLRVPLAYLTPQLVIGGIKYDKEAIKKLDPSVMTEDVVMEMVSGAYYIGYNVWEALPSRLKTPRVAGALIANAAIPIKQIPPTMLTIDAIQKRLRPNPSEYEDIPKSLITPLNAIEIVRGNATVMKFMPDSVMTEPLLFEFMSAAAHAMRSYNSSSKDFEKQFARFPKTLWSERVVSLGIELRFLDAKAESVPQEYMSKSVASSLLARDANEIGLIPEDFLDEDTLAVVASKNVNILGQLSPDKVTEPVAFAAVRAHAFSQYSRPMLAEMPRANWSQRVYMAAVGYVVSLNEVPRKWRSEELIQEAVKRDPYNIRFTDHPSEWMANNVAIMKSASRDWLNKFENAGFFKSGRHFIDVEELEKEALPNGAYCVVTKVGSANKRAFIFDKRQKLVGRIFTKDDKVQIPYLVNLKGHRQTVVEVIRRHFNYYKAGDLNSLEIYQSPNSGLLPAEELPRVPDKTNPTVKWAIADTSNDFDKKFMFIGNRLVFDFTTGSTSAWGNRSRRAVQSAIIHDMKLALRYSSDIFRKVCKENYRWSRDLQKIGIMATRNGDWFNLRNEKVGEVGELSVWRMGNRVAIFGELGLMAHAMVRKNGTIGNINVDYNYSKLEEKLAETFYALQSKLPYRSGK